MGDCCGNNLDVQHMARKQRQVLWIVMIVNIITFAGMVFASWLSHSSSLLSGTLDNLGDALTYAVSLVAVGLGVAAKARVALFKGLLISLAALGVAAHIVWRLAHPEVPVATTMGIAAMLNLAANGLCLYLLAPLRFDDVNMASVYECSRNDVFEGVAVIVTACLVWLTGSHWPDLVVACFLLVMFSRSALRVLRSGWQELREVSPA